MITPPTLAGFRALSVRILTPWRGAWVAEVDIDPGDVSLVPSSGPAQLAVGGFTCNGAVDSRWSGSFGARAAATVVGGNGGWDKPLPAQSWVSDSQVTQLEVFQATAAAVGETVAGVSGATLGLAWDRAAGPASAVFDGMDYYVGFDGITHLDARPTPTADTSFEILEWYPLEQRAVVACDALIVPGLVLSDPRLNGANPVVRDVLQTFTKSGGARATLWCSQGAVSPLITTLSQVARAAVRPAYLKGYRYRVVLQESDGRIALQAVQTSAGMPDMLPISIWPGMQGVTARVALSSECVVVFIDGDPAQPIVTNWRSTDLPLQLSLDASALVKVGPSAAATQIAGGGQPLVLGTAFYAELALIAAGIAGAGGSYTPSAPDLLLSAKAETG